MFRPLRSKFPVCQPLDNNKYLCFTNIPNFQIFKPLKIPNLRPRAPSPFVKCLELRKGAASSLWSCKSLRAISIFVKYLGAAKVQKKEDDFSSSCVEVYSGLAFSFSAFFSARRAACRSFSSAFSLASRRLSASSAR